MKGIVLAVFSTVAISLSDAHFRKKPNIEVFEIRENQNTKQIQVQPVKLKYGLESEEKEPLLSKLSKLLLSYKKKKINDVSKDVWKKIKKAKGLQVPKKPNSQQPVVLMVSPEYLDMLDSSYQSDQDSLSSFLDETRTQALLKPGSEVVFNIVPPKRARKALKVPRLPIIFRHGDGVEDRTNPPPPRHGDRPYVYDYGNEHY